MTQHSLFNSPSLASISLWLAVLLAACAGSPPPPGDAAAESTRIDSGVDSPVALDLPSVDRPDDVLPELAILPDAFDAPAPLPDIPTPLPDAPPDAPTPCGSLDQPCCAASPSCAPPLLCRGARCAACPAGESLCGDACRDLRADALHCGACGVACPAGLVCAAGACACPAPAVRCGDACVDTATASAHCGACGSACDGVLPGATARCEASRCVIASCDAGRADCDGDPRNGCEAHLTSSATDCGACGRACVAPPGLGVSCQEGRCVVGTVCAPGLADCTAAPGCETTPATDLLHCGGCGRACSAQHATPRCEAGRCALTCEAGFGDCDGDPDNGCEVALAADARHCGACGAACVIARGAGRCDAGRCAVVSCEAGYADCDRDAGNGCEAALDTSVAHCGSCAIRCGAAAHASPACRGGACAVNACDAGWGDCDGVGFNGCETALTTPSSCGGCGVVCGGARQAVGTCAAGACGFACNRDYADCDGVAANGCEVNLSADPRHCGACGRSCDTEAPYATPRCVSGVCAIACAVTHLDCDGVAANGCEVDYARDDANCGSCGRTCVAPRVTAACRGTCTVVACSEGRGDCNLSYFDGCERDLRVDPAHCGACGRACPAVTGANRVVACAAGVCGAACARGFADCDGDAGNGCEHDGRSDRARCGACGRRCPAGTDCVSGECAPPPPAALLAPLSHHAAVLARDGRVYVFGAGRTERYDVAANAWSARAPMPAPLRGCSAAALADGRVLVVNGYDTSGRGAQRTAWYYDPAADTWRAAPPPFGAREGAAISTAPDGVVWVIGPNLGSGLPVETFDPRTERWTERFGAPVGPYNVAQHLDGVLIVWGNVSTAAHLPHRHDPGLNQWIPLDHSTSLGRGRYGLASAKGAAGFVYFFGGEVSEGTPVPPREPAELVADPYSWAARPIAPMAIRRQYAAAVALPDGRILVIGGQRVSDRAPIASVEAYSPTGDFWR